MVLTLSYRANSLTGAHEPLVSCSSGGFTSYFNEIQNNRRDSHSVSERKFRSSSCFPINGCNWLSCWWRRGRTEAKSPSVKEKSAVNRRCSWSDTEAATCFSIHSRAISRQSMSPSVSLRSLSPAKNLIYGFLQNFGTWFATPAVSMATPTNITPQVINRHPAGAQIVRKDKIRSDDHSSTGFNQDCQLCASSNHNPPQSAANSISSPARVSDAIQNPQGQKLLDPRTTVAKRSLVSGMHQRALKLPLVYPFSPTTIRCATVNRDSSAPVTPVSNIPTLSVYRRSGSHASSVQSSTAGDKRAVLKPSRQRTETEDDKSSGIYSTESSSSSSNVARETSFSHASGDVCTSTKLTESESKISDKTGDRLRRQMNRQLKASCSSITPATKPPNHQLTYSMGATSVSDRHLSGNSTSDSRTQSIELTEYSESSKNMRPSTEDKNKSCQIIDHNKQGQEKSRLPLATKSILKRGLAQPGEGFASSGDRCVLQEVKSKNTKKDAGKGVDTLQCSDTEKGSDPGTPCTRSIMALIDTPDLINDSSIGSLENDFHKLGLHWRKRLKSTRCKGHRFDSPPRCQRYESPCCSCGHKHEPESPANNYWPLQNTGQPCYPICCSLCSPYLPPTNAWYGGRSVPPPLHHMPCNKAHHTCQKQRRVPGVNSAIPPESMWFYPAMSANVPPTPQSLGLARELIAHSLNRSKPPKCRRHPPPYHQVTAETLTKRRSRGMSCR